MSFTALKNSTMKKDESLIFDPYSDHSDDDYSPMINIDYERFTQYDEYLEDHLLY